MTGKNEAAAPARQLFSSGNLPSGFRRLIPGGGKAGSVGVHAGFRREIGGTGPKLSDAFNALSRGRIDAGWNHADSYYSRNGADWRYLEALADILAVEGMGPFGARLLDRCFPATAEQVREILRQASAAAP